VRPYGFVRQLVRSQKYKDDAVELVISSGRPIAQIASDIGVNEGTLGTWVRKYREEHPDRFVTEEKAPVSWKEHQKALAENAKLKQESSSWEKSAPSLQRSNGRRFLRVHRS
jgi:transposase